MFRPKPQKRLHRHRLHVYTYGCVAIAMTLFGSLFSVFAVFYKGSQIGKVWLAGPTSLVVAMVLCGKVLIDWGPAHSGHQSDTSSECDELLQQSNDPNQVIRTIDDNYVQQKVAQAQALVQLDQMGLLRHGIAAEKSAEGGACTSDYSSTRDCIMIDSIEDGRNFQSEPRRMRSQTVTDPMFSSFAKALDHDRPPKYSILRRPTQVDAWRTVGEFGAPSPEPWQRLSQIDMPPITNHGTTTESADDRHHHHVRLANGGNEAQHPHNNNYTINDDDGGGNGDDGDVNRRHTHNHPQQNSLMQRPTSISTQHQPAAQQATTREQHMIVTIEKVKKVRESTESAETQLMTGRLHSHTDNWKDKRPVHAEDKCCHCARPATSRRGGGGDMNRSETLGRKKRQPQQRDGSNWKSASTPDIFNNRPAGPYQGETFLWKNQHYLI